jgi:His-Xaa-Ser system radical SAM maturase HxsC
MLEMESKVELNHWPPQTLLVKVAGLAEFASGRYALERMVLDLRDDQVAAHIETMGMLPWAGFIASDKVTAPPGRPSMKLLGEPAIVKQGDVLEVQPQRYKVAVRYRRGGNGNVLFATERCNSYCLMCSQPPREVDDAWRVAQLCELVELIDPDLPSVAISGGEPTLLGEGLHRIVTRCAQRLPNTALHVLSNGRRFGETLSAEPYRNAHPALSWGVPLYGDTHGLHDYVVQSAGAFAQTLRGLYALHAAGQRIEVRVVLVRPSVERLEQLARFLYRNLPFVEHVALMGVEPIGFARANREALWIDPADTASQLEAAVVFLDRRGMSVSLYNMPLCTLPRSLWPFARRSISDWKQDYLEACNGCEVRQACSGVFGWKTPGWTSRAIKSIRMEMSDA